METEKDVLQVGDDNTLRLEGVSGVGFTLTRVAGRGTYPLLAKGRESGASPFRITGEHVYYQGSALGDLDVDVTPGGGEPGDTWRLTVVPAATDGRDTRFPTNRKGQLIAAPAGGELLFHLDSDNPAHRALLLDFDGADFGGPGDNVLMVDPVGRESLVVTNGSWNPVFDLTSFRRVLFVYEQWTTEDYVFQNAFKPIIREVGPQGGRRVEDFTMGSSGDFGSADGLTVLEKPVGKVELGAPGPDALASFFRRTASLPAYAQFGIAVEGLFSVNPALYDGGDAHIRLWAVGY
ncbi:hypothetical protein [Archangium sp.]|uniref:hypothetical protein n=1 Tax=Archangium sp. TaxID=1872627 RepID=UPI00286CB641|nr:hypothetical protein [Archangium sp.]